LVIDPALLILLGGLLALDGTSVGQFMFSRPLVAGILAGWVMGDATMGLVVGGVLEFYFIAVFPVGGADFPEGGPPTLVAVVGATLLPGVEGLALGVLLGLVWSRLAALSIHFLRKVNGRLAPDPSKGPVTVRRVFWAHLAAMGLDFLRGCLLTLFGLWVARWAAEVLQNSWPLSPTHTLGLLLVGASIPAGAFVQSVGGWRKRGVLLAAGLTGFLIGSYLL
jgi:mannose/fructose/N-acetylgalactosamine-specific phosphotransferase system component IIC